MTKTFREKLPSIVVTAVAVGIVSGGVAVIKADNAATVKDTRAANEIAARFAAAPLPQQFESVARGLVKITCKDIATGEDFNLDTKNFDDYRKNIQSGNCQVTSAGYHYTSPRVALAPQ